jgi:predicted Zn-dependent protease
MEPRRLALALAAAALACATSPMGRSQLILVPADEMDSMGAAAYDKMKQEMKTSDDAALARWVQCVSGAVTAQVKGPYAGRHWEVTVFDDPTPNAFALPGGKIGVHSGLMKVARSQDQLAAVLGHEVGHVLANHGAERVSTEFVAQSGLSAIQVLSGAPSPAQQQLLGLLGVGAQVGVLLPFSRAQEAEADEIGLDLMADAGFDPRESVTLWENMTAYGGPEPPELLSTHPANASRMADLRARMPEATAREQAAHAQGRHPSCGAPPG